MLPNLKMSLLQRLSSIISGRDSVAVLSLGQLCVHVHLDSQFRQPLQNKGFSLAVHCMICGGLC